MTIRRHFTLLVFISLLLAQCAHKQNNHLPAHTSFNLKARPYLSSPSLFRVWYYGFPFYSSELTIHTNGTFTFHDRGCTGQGYSEGRWEADGSGIILNSFKQYAADNMPEIIEIKTTPPSPVRKKKRTIGKIGLVYYDYVMPLSTFTLKIPDTSNVYFSNTHLIPIGDTLYELDKNGLQTTAKYIPGERTD